MGVKSYALNGRSGSTSRILTLNDPQSEWFCDYSTVIFSATFFPMMWFLVFFAGMAFVVIKCSNVEKTDSKNKVDVERNCLQIICDNWWCHYLRSLDSTIRLAQTDIFYYKKKINMMISWIAYKMLIWSCLDHNKSKFSYKWKVQSCFTVYQNYICFLNRVFNLTYICKYVCKIQLFWEGHKTFVAFSEKLNFKSKTMWVSLPPLGDGLLARWIWTEWILDFRNLGTSRSSWG